MLWYNMTYGVMQRHGTVWLGIVHSCHRQSLACCGSARGVPRMSLPFVPIPPDSPVLTLWGFRPIYSLFMGVPSVTFEVAQHLPKEAYGTGATQAPAAGHCGQFKNHYELKEANDRVRKVGSLSAQHFAHPDGSRNSVPRTDTSGINMWVTLCKRRVSFHGVDKMHPPTPEHEGKSVTDKDNWDISCFMVWFMIRCEIALQRVVLGYEYVIHHA